MRLVFDFHHHYQPRRLIFTKPRDSIVATTLTEVRPALRAAEQAARNGCYVAGYLAYEAAPAFDDAHRVRQGCALPLVWFGVFEQPESFSLADNATFTVGEWRPSVNHRHYENNIERIRAAIARGETYQVNYTLRQRTEFQGESFAFYEQLARAQRAAYCAYLDLGQFQILSASPELFFHRNAATITTRPMKGTTLRGRWGEEDEARAAWLQSSEKNRAENIMIVDLLRNDLGRIAIPGSVHAESLFNIEPYPTVHQMTSTVTAQERPGITLEDVFAALFPCGSVTGAPKIGTMGIIAELESDPRQIYCGAIGLIEPGGEATFNVAIRTVLIDSETGTAEYGVGGGIVWDSGSDDEYREIANKTAVLHEPWPRFELLETMRADRESIFLLDRHLERLLASARYFAIPLNEAEARAALREHHRNLPDGQWRMRLLVDGSGQVRIESTPLTATGDSVQKVALANSPVTRHNRFLYHKTTHRELYERHRAEHPGAFDVLLWNEEAEMTEFTIGNIVVELDGELWTPPLDCGLLPGTLRAELLANGQVAERVMIPADLQRATRMWLINGVRGWVRVELTA